MKLASVAVLVLAVAAGLAKGPLPAEGTDEREGTEAAQVARIRAHLEGAEALLRRRDLSALSPNQRAARERHVEALRAYRERGVFPHNHDFEGRRPAFVDDHGTLCAMAHLIATSGRLDLVRRVAATRNNAYVRELAGDPELVAWLEAAGLTADEAARIQPDYDFERAPSCPEGLRAKLAKSPEPELDDADRRFLSFHLGHSKARSDDERRLVTKPGRDSPMDEPRSGGEKKGRELVAEWRKLGDR
ncbi:hypothetical protein HY251_08385, partial [bacterium]|nr:hypothetical protein [bacterium]